MLYRCSLRPLAYRRPQLLAVLLLVLVLYLWPKGKQDADYYREKYPLAWKHVHLPSEQGGIWYIPPNWLKPTDPLPTTIVEAAHLAYSLAMASSRTIPYSSIPLIVHQTWKDTKVDRWPQDLAHGVEKWLSYATVGGNASMAYFLWLDKGCKQLIAESEPQIVDIVDALPLQAEKSDVFRVVVLNSIGGIYEDIDTVPLRSPASWLDETDISPWKDTETGKTYSTTSNPSPSVSRPIQLLLGIEGDNDPNSDAYWRMGYNYHVQLTQWAFASAPRHPILDRVISAFTQRVNQLAKPYGGNVTTAARAGVLKKEDPLKLAGPEAVTAAAMEWLQEKTGLRWDALSGLKDGGRSKVVGDTVIFPITAFSPGRGRLGNMGSKPVTDPDARVWHGGQGSWKKIDLKVEFGKFCRTMFGSCRDWSPVPQ
ncbi:glycosyltransferase family 32 protein [Leptodontidium sp. 2 PMI_412]|nr:glycosyltransferase family 32 protein [Leptodontidium sp. 2 PMI_412]